MKLRLATLLLSLAPLGGMAQTLPSLVPTMASGATPLVDQLLALDASGRPVPGQDAPVLPIWSGSDGKLLAVVALPRGWVNSPIDATPSYAGPSAWHLTGSTAAGGGLQWQLGNGFRADALLGQYALAAAPATCTATDCDLPRWSNSTLTGLLGFGWSSAETGLDLSYGLSWLQSQPAGNIAFGNPAQGKALVPLLTLADARPFSLDQETALYARGRWRFEHGPTLDIGASYARSRLSATAPIGTALAPGIDLDQLSLSLGLDAGSLRGAIVGHVLSSDDPALAGKRWTTLDLGVSWRTPWSGELSVGTQHLWGGPGASSRDAEGQTRTPYIQYRQDL